LAQRNAPRAPKLLAWGEPDKNGNIGNRFSAKSDVDASKNFDEIWPDHFAVRQS
jgi:hypothetical protein